MKKVHIFPGQGAQFPGMAEALYHGNDDAKSLMERANEILGFRITDIMFTGSGEDLKATRVTQPAVFLHSVAIALCTPGISGADMAAGHSLGEFSALVAAGALKFEDGLKLVAIRAREMQKCCEQANGKMAAIINLPIGKIEEICASVDGIVIPANYNSDAQTVISGEAAAVDKACALMKEAGAKRALPLNVAGAFHSPLMEPARAALARAVESTEFAVPACPIYQNVSARGETDPEIIKKNVIAQLTSPVRWNQSVKAMLADGATDFVEMGPGKVLQGLVSRIAGDAEGITISGIQ